MGGEGWQKGAEFDGLRTPTTQAPTSASPSGAKCESQERNQLGLIDCKGWVEGLVCKGRIAQCNSRSCGTVNFAPLGLRITSSHLYWQHGSQLPVHGYTDSSICSLGGDTSSGHQQPGLTRTGADGHRRRPPGRKKVKRGRETYEDV